MLGLSKVKNKLKGEVILSNTVTKKPKQLKALLSQEEVKSRFQEILGKKAAGFMSTLLTISNSPSLKDADAQSILTAGAIAATMDLPVNPNLGFAHIVAYKKQAQLQIGVKGFVQLAIRSGQYEYIDAFEVYEGEIKKINRFTGEIEFGERLNDEVVGYFAFFKTLNGFKKHLYMSKEEVEKHGKRYSANFKYGKGLWVDNFNAMAVKTVLKQLLSKYGLLSIETQSVATAIQADQATINVSAETGEFEFEYPDAIEVSVSSEIESQTQQEFDELAVTPFKKTPTEASYTYGEVE